MTKRSQTDIQMDAKRIIHVQVITVLWKDEGIPTERRSFAISNEACLSSYSRFTIHEMACLDVDVANLWTQGWDSRNPPTTR